MKENYRRYESGMMLPPVTDEQRWLEAQRIMADIIDQPSAYAQEIADSKLVTVEGLWTNDTQESKAFVLERHVSVNREGYYTSHVLTVENNSAQSEVFYIDASDPIDVRKDGDEQQETLQARREEVCRILGSISLDTAIGGMHAEFERLITYTLAQETPFAITTPMMNWSEAVWDTYVHEYKRRQKIHRQSRINPAYLVPGMYNSQFQLQLDAAVNHKS